MFSRLRHVLPRVAEKSCQLVTLMNFDGYFRQKVLLIRPQTIQTKSVMDEL